MRKFPPPQPNQNTQQNQPSKIARPQPPIPGKSTNTGNENKTSPVIQNNNTINSNSNVIDTISNKLREGIDEMITNLAIVSQKTIELEKQNIELRKQINWKMNLKSYKKK